MATQLSPKLPTRTVVRRRAIWLFVLAALTGLYLFPTPANWVIRNAGKIIGVDLTNRQISNGFALGLDLRGGSRLEYEADVSKIPAVDRQEALNGVRDVIERRVNALGVSEPLVQTTQAGNSWRVNVELAGIRDVNEAIKKIGETPILEFKEEGAEAARDLTEEEKTNITAKNIEAKAKAQALLQAALQPGADFGKLGAAAIGSTTALPSEFIRGNAQAEDIYAELRLTSATGTLNRIIESEIGLYVVHTTEVKLATKEAKGRHLLIAYKDAQLSESTLTKEQAKAKITDLKKQANLKNFETLVKQFSTEPNASSTGGVLDWVEEKPASAGAMQFVESFAKPFFALPKNQISEVIETPYGFHLMLKTDERSVYDHSVQVASFKKLTKADILPPSDGWKATKLTGKQLSTARVDFNQQTGGIQVALQFNDEGSDLFAEITKKNIGKRVGIFIDGQLISAPTVQSEIPGGQAVITGAGSLEEARALARSLQAGALPVPVELIAQQTVGPSLGSDSLQASLKAGLIGFAFVALFMIFLYRLPGLMAIVALALYAGLSLTIFKYIPVTLTLSGIAGFILSIGIAVDANVLVFERLKEEWRLGKSLPVALEDAFRRAWPSIRDGHVTVLISSAVLYLFSSSVIRGFSVTLGVGIVISLFTAVVSCRALLRFLAQTSLAKHGWLFLQPRDLSKKS